MWLHCCVKIRSAHATTKYNRTKRRPALTLRTDTVHSNKSIKSSIYFEEWLSCVWRFTIISMVFALLCKSIEQHEILEREKKTNEIQMKRVFMHCLHIGAEQWAGRVWCSLATWMNSVCRAIKINCVYFAVVNSFVMTHEPLCVCVCVCKLWNLMKKMESNGRGGGCAWWRHDSKIPFFLGRGGGGWGNWKSIQRALIKNNDWQTVRHVAAVDCRRRCGDFLYGYVFAQRACKYAAKSKR